MSKGKRPTEWRNIRKRKSTTSLSLKRMQESILSANVAASPWELISSDWKQKPSEHQMLHAQKIVTDRSERFITDSGGNDFKGSLKLRRINKKALYISIGIGLFVGMDIILLQFIMNYLKS